MSEGAKAAPMDNLKTVYLIDTYNLIFKAFFAFANKPLITTYKMNISAVYGFLNMLHKILNDYEPTYVVCVHDTGEKTFREDIYEGYKAQRPECPEDLVPQFDVIFEFIDALSLPRLSKPGLEADDIIGTIAKKAVAGGYCAKIISSDRDLFQLISDSVHMISLKKGISEIVEYGPELLKQEYKIRPQEVVLYKSLVGDPSDNIPGVHGIGPKAAEELISRFKSLDEIYNNIEMITGRKKELLLAGREKAYLSYRLAEIECDGDFPVDIENYRKFDPDIDKFHSLCVKYEQKKMFERYSNYFEKRSGFFYGH